MLHDEMSGVADSLAGAMVTGVADLAAEFEDRLRESSTLVVRVAYSVLRHRQDAEDVAQEAFERAYRRFAHLRDRDRFRAWIVRITWRLAIDRRRSDQRRLRREQTAVTLPASSTEMHAAERERAQHLHDAIDRLPEKLRIVVILAAIEGHGIREVAQLLGLPEGTVKSRLFQARKSLAESLQWIAND